MNRSPRNNLKKHLAVPLMVAGTLFFASMATHAAQEVAVMTNHGTALSWHPTGTYEKASLSISNPDGTVSDQTFANHQQISITTPAADGSYTYELVLSPMVPPGLRAQMDEHRANHPGEKFMGGVVGSKQSGSFTVAGGTIIDGSTAE